MRPTIFSARTQQQILRSVYTCDFSRTLTVFFSRNAATSNRTFKPAATSVRFHLDIAGRFLRNPASLHQVSNIFETQTMSWQNIALKSPLVYTGDLKLQFESNKSGTKKIVIKTALVNEPLRVKAQGSRLI